jgi:protein O-mannosyl-transferase
MGKTGKPPAKKKMKPTAVSRKQPAAGKGTSLIGWIILVMIITAICFFPMLKNNFTNWDDDFYVLNNPLLRAPDWQGIFTQPVVGNYHPLTVITLAINYQLSGTEPFGYLFVNYLMHVANAGLVFYFTYLLSNKKTWVAFFVALAFAIHPMHVESVAWVAERKDVLYTLFFLLSLIQYWKFLQSGAKRNYWFCFLFFALSLLSKPAAVILPLLLLLIDHWKGKPLKSKLFIEKIPFFILSLLFGIITIRIQSATAITGLDTFPLWTRFFFACYVLMIYFVRFFVPYPLSAFHPYPPPDDLGLAIYLSPLFVLVIAVAIWFFRKNKIFTFGILFFVINLLLVLQLITIGSTLVSERYTYVPYIGIAFMLAMWLNSRMRSQVVRWIPAVTVALVFGVMSFQRTKTWKDSETLWTDVLNKFPNTAVPRNQRAIFYGEMTGDPANQNRRNELYQKALEDLNVALKVKPDYINALENRQHIYMDLDRNEEALADAETLISLAPSNYRGYYTKGIVYSKLDQPARAVPELKKSISLNPGLDNAFNLLGSILVNVVQDYPSALDNFNKAISLNPKGDYYFNRSVCYYRMGNLQTAKADAQTALQKGMNVPDDYRRLLSL